MIEGNSNFLSSYILNTLSYAKYYSKVNKKNLDLAILKDTA